MEDVNDILNSVPLLVEIMIFLLGGLSLKIWQKYIFPFLNKKGITNDYSKETVVEDFFKNTKIWVYKHTIYLINGDILICDTEELGKININELPHGDFYQDKEGNITCYVTGYKHNNKIENINIVSDKQNKTFDMTFIPVSSILKVEYETKNRN